MAFNINIHNQGFWIKEFIMKKKTVLVLVCTALLCGPLWAQTAADFTYRLNSTNDGVIITGYTGTATRVTIPAEIEGLPVREIAPNAFRGITSIPADRFTWGARTGNNPWTFRGTFETSIYTAVLTVTTRNHVSNSGPNAMAVGASGNLVVTYKITHVIIPEGVTIIGASAFAETRIALSANLHYDTSISYSSTGALSSVTIPGTVTEIGESAFENCQRLNALTLPPSLRTLGRRAFANTAGLRTIVIPDGYTSLPREVFSGSGLTSITLPQTLLSIGHSAFSGCSSLASITLPDSVLAIEDSAFANSGLTSFSWPAEMDFIPPGVFAGTRLRTLVIPDWVTEIGDGAFRSCRELTSVMLSPAIRTIHANAFGGCSALTTVTVPDSVTSIRFLGQGAFSGSSIGLVNQAALNRLGYTGTF